MTKLASTITIAFNLVMARTFGRYVHSIGGAGWPSMAVYVWRGRKWYIPTSTFPGDHHD
jgi:hypothetical protein